MQLHTQKVNTYFQEKYWLYFKPLPMTACILTSTVLINPKLRATTFFSGLTLCIYTVLNSYILLAIGHYIPLKLNDVSIRNLEFLTLKILGVTHFQNLNADGRSKLAGIIVYIYIGYENFYEKNTALNILNFIIDQTINMNLMF